VSYYQEGHNRTVDKNIGVLKISESFLSLSSLVGQTYPTRSEYFRRVPEPWHWSQIGYIRRRSDISDTSDISKSGSGSSTVAVRLDQTYPTSDRIYPTSWTCPVFI
jgi:hypothetical protein